MSEANQRAYLEAMEIPVWVRKENVNRESVNRECEDQTPGFVSPALKLGPGAGDVLLVCKRVDEPATRIAADIARSLKAEPVWAWPAADAAGSDMETSVNEYLFTTIIVFGKSLQKQVFNGSAPESLGSARILKAPGMEKLCASSSARQALWKLICNNRLAGQRRASDTGTPSI